MLIWNKPFNLPFECQNGTHWMFEDRAFRIIDGKGHEIFDDIFKALSPHMAICLGKFITELMRGQA